MQAQIQQAFIVQTKLITLDVPLLKAESVVALRSDELRSHIETQLTQHGSPLRWAITVIDKSAQTAHVEAVVTTL
ncbi:MAG: hypothetical protein AAF703_05090 [Cyanobacteria bacterium P01_D01_bin.105]